MTKRILIDADPGIDDACAILLALASPEISLEGVSIVHGNCSLEQATINGLSILELGNASHIPLARGCELPLVQPSLLAPETHGNTGLGYANLPIPQSKPIRQHGCDFLIERILASPGEISLVAIGPLTNVALAIRQEPRIVDSLKELIIMGGAIRSEGNTTALAEFNTYVDPHAAHIVFHAGIPTTLVPLDVTYQCILTEQDVARLQVLDSPITTFIKDATRFYMEYHDDYQGIEGCVINDPLALALTFAPQLCDYQELPVDVDISGGISTGKTLADFYNYGKKPANMKVALRVRPRDFIDLFIERIETLAQSNQIRRQPSN
ncbi:MAG TPA: nucleoside hydrolase [Anaerolineales bacterium]|nr:nucleoside hydrolase [Anaerolineales bacterium]